MQNHDSPQPESIAFRRRRFLQGSTLIAGGAIAVGSPVRGLAAGVAPEHLDGWLALFADSTPVSTADYAPVALTSAELSTLKAAIDRIIPADDLGPGASEAGVHVFIDRSLKGPNAALVPLYQAGLAALDKAAGGAGFTAAATDQQDKLLTSAEGGKLDGAPAGFFVTLLTHTRQGMFGDPIYGGNVNFAGWDLIGFPGMKLTWSAEEQALDTTVQPAHVSVAKYGGKSW